MNRIIGLLKRKFKMVLVFIEVLLLGLAIYCLSYAIPDTSQVVIVFTTNSLYYKGVPPPENPIPEPFNYPLCYPYFGYGILLIVLASVLLAVYLGYKKGKSFNFRETLRGHKRNRK